MDRGVGYSPWGHKESDTTKRLSRHACSHLVPKSSSPPYTKPQSNSGSIQKWLLACPKLGNFHPQILGSTSWPALQNSITKHCLILRFQKEGASQCFSQLSLCWHSATDPPAPRAWEAPTKLYLRLLQGTSRLSWKCVSRAENLKGSEPGQTLLVSPGSPVAPTGSRESVEVCL